MQLKLVVRDTKAEPVHALAQMYDLVANDCVAFIGPATSQTTKDVSTWLTKIPTENRAVIGYSATSGELGGEEYAKNFVRTPPADNAVATKMALLMAGLLVLGVVWDMFELAFKSSA